MSEFQSCHQHCCYPGSTLVLSGYFCFQSRFPSFSHGFRVVTSCTFFSFKKVSSGLVQSGVHNTSGSRHGSTRVIVLVATWKLDFLKVKIKLPGLGSKKWCRGLEGQFFYSTSGLPGTHARVHVCIRVTLSYCNTMYPGDCASRHVTVQRTVPSWIRQEERKFTALQQNCQKRKRNHLPSGIHRVCTHTRIL